jgi:hypothetical protein
MNGVAAGLQTTKVLRRLLAMAAAHAGGPGPDVPSRASLATWWTATVPCRPHTRSLPPSPVIWVSGHARSPCGVWDLGLVMRRYLRPRGLVWPSGP